MSRRPCLYMLLIALAAPCFCLGQSKDYPAERSSVRIVGYLPDYRAEDIDSDSLAQLTDLILFSAEVHPSGELNLARLKSMPWQKLKKQKTQHRLRMILCVGGWERSDGFALMASDLNKRQVFLESAIATCMKYRLDGIDLDWEHPKSSREQIAYGQLLSELKAGFEPHGLCLSMTMAAWQEVPKQAFDAVDWVQVMAYDHPGKHSTLDNAKLDVERLVKAGAPISKLTLGIPFYGRKVQDGSQVKTYRELVASNSKNLTDATNEFDEYYFNGPKMVKTKVQYSLESGMAGVMVWEIGQDAVGDKSLLRLIRQSIP